MITEAPNAAQATYWNDTVGSTWVSVQEPLDRQLGPLGEAAMLRLKPVSGERILDIGCGAGATSLMLAEAVAPEGAVTGFDLSATLLAAAKARGAGVAELDFLEGDAQAYPFERGAYDAAFSRFGVMFFTDPVAAFANIRAALKPAGRLAFVCWRAAEDNPVMVLPMQAAAALIPPELAPSPPTPNAPGPFAFANPDRIRDVLTGGGFEDIDITPDDQNVGAGDLDAALSVALRVGGLGTLLREYPELSDTIAPAVREALAKYDGLEGVRLQAATWIVTAHAPSA